MNTQSRVCNMYV